MAGTKSKSKSKEQDAEKIQKKKDAFARVVPTRVDNAIKAIRLLKQCSSTNYVYSDTQGRAIVTAIKNEYEALKDAFEGEKKATGGFQLPEA